MKRIAKIYIKHILDENPDTSWLGEYTDKASDWCIVRRESEYLHVLEERAWREEYNEYVSSCQESNETPDDFKTWKDETYFHGYELPSFGRECRFFVPYAGGEKPGSSNYIKYGMQDFERMEGLCNGNWYFIGIRAIAEVQTSRDGKNWLRNKISSGGLWGIESDCDQSYIEEEHKNQLADLKTQLREFGFSVRAINAAMKDIEVKE